MRSQVESFHKRVTLTDGSEVVLRLMTPGDREPLLELFAAVSEQDATFLRHDVRNPSVVNRWCENLDYGRVLPLTAWDGERAIGQATLHIGQGPERHIARVRMYVAVDFRRRGLGSALLKALTDLARTSGLQQLVAEIVSEQTALSRTCIRQGFELCYTMQDHFMFPDGSTGGVTILRLCLEPPCEPETVAIAGDDLRTGSAR